MFFNKPILLNYYITYRCNSKCVFCDIWQNKKYLNIHNAQLSIIHQNLLAAKRLGIRFVDFTGGEPLLYKELPEALRLAKEHKFYTSVTTNCLLYPKRAKEIKGLVDLLHFSIDAPNRETHDALRGVPTYDKFIESIEIAKSLGEKADLEYTITPENIETLPEMIKFAQKYKLMLIVNPVFNYFSDSANSRLTKEHTNYIKKFFWQPYTYINLAFLDFIANGGNDIKNPRCFAIDSSIVISPDNFLLLPCFHHTTKRILLNDNLEEIYHSEIVNKIRKQQGRLSFCENCTINCYFDPSFLYKLDKLFWLSLFSKACYGLDKYIRGK